MSHIHCDGSPFPFRNFSFMALSANFCHLSCNTFHTAILMVIWCHYVPILLSLYLTWIVVALKRLFLAIFNVLMQKYFRIHLSGKRCEKCHSIITHSHTHTHWTSILRVISRYGVDIPLAEYSGGSVRFDKSKAIAWQSVVSGHLKHYRKSFLHRPISCELTI